MATLREYRRAMQKAVELLLDNPVLFLRILALQTRRLRRAPPSVGQTDVFGLRMEFDFTLDPVLRLMWKGVYEPLTAEAMRRLLRPGDVVLDAGANVGYLTAVAAGMVGPSGQVHAFEPEPSCFRQLERLLELNPGRHIVLNRCAVGDKNDETTINIAAPGSIMGSTAVPGLMPEDRRRSSIRVPMARLDSYIERHRLCRIALVKIDVEGFELRVLRGLDGYVQRAEHPPNIICEITPDAYSLQHLSMADMADCVRALGYAARRLTNPARPVNIEKLTGPANVLLVPQRGEMKERLA
jgi:FkbM family methyltransferase